MTHTPIRNRSTALVGLIALALFGCGGSSGNPDGTGGTSTGSGGSASGGSSGTGSGGKASSGGSPGANGSGGQTASGGSSASGGATGSGGTTASGGSPGMGGANASGTGGRGMTGGRSGSSGGAGGTSGATGGASGGGSSGTPSGDAIPSEGCSATPTTTACDKQATPCMVDVKGTARQYWTQLPDGYDPKYPYPVVFQYHPLGGNGWQGLTMYQIRPKFPKAIYVSPDGLKSGSNQGFSNTNGEDEDLTRTMMAELESKYCVDKARYYSTGFSFGGSMSYTAACNMSDVFRAIGAMSGAPISGAKCTTKKPARPVAVWATHGDADTALPITMAQPIIDALAKYNGCSTTTAPVDPSPCVEYQGCMTGYPVVWCVRPGDPHAIPSFAAAAIAKFFQQF